MLVYAQYKRNQHQGPAWEKLWYADAESDLYIGTGLPESFADGPTEDRAAKMSVAFPLAAGPGQSFVKDADLDNLNRLLTLKEPGDAERREILDLTNTLNNRYPEPRVRPGDAVFAVEDEDYRQHAWDMQDMVRHSVPKTKIGSVFATAAESASAHAYTVQEGPRSMKKRYTQFAETLEKIFAFKI